MEPPPLAEAAGLREGRAWAGTNLALEAGNRRGLGSGRNRRGARNREGASTGRVGEARQEAAGAASPGRAGAGQRTRPNPATARPVCACAGARSAPPSTWDCALGPAVRWEL